MTNTALASTRRCAAIAGMAAWTVIFQAAAAQGDDVVQLKDDRYRRVVLENSVVRVWEVMVPVGEWTAFHEHKIDMVAVRINTTELTNEPKGGLFSFKRDYKLEAGSVSYSEYNDSPYIHRISPKGPNPHRVIEFEILTPAGGGTSPAPDRPAFSTILANSRIRASRLVLEPSQSSDQLAPRKNTLAVMVKGEGAMESKSLKAGGFMWYGEAGPRSIRNEGASRVELVEVEVK